MPTTIKILFPSYRISPKMLVGKKKIFLTKFFWRFVNAGRIAKYLNSVLEYLITGTLHNRENFVMCT